MRQILPHHKLSLADTAKAHAIPSLAQGGASGRFMIAARELEQRGALNYDTARELSKEFFPWAGWPATPIRQMIIAGALKVDWTRAPRAPAAPIEEADRCVSCGTRRRDAPFSECARCNGNRTIRLGLIAKRGV